MRPVGEQDRRTDHDRAASLRARAAPTPGATPRGAAIADDHRPQARSRAARTPSAPQSTCNGASVGWFRYAQHGDDTEATSTQPPEHPAAPAERERTSARSRTRGARTRRMPRRRTRGRDRAAPSTRATGAYRRRPGASRARRAMRGASAPDQTACCGGSRKNAHAAARSARGDGPRPRGVHRAWRRTAYRRRSRSSATALASRGHGRLDAEFEQPLRPSREAEKGVR